MSSDEAEDDVLEHCTLRIPYEELNRCYRTGHKNIERSLAKIQRVGNAIKERLSGSNEPVSKEQIRKAYRTLRGLVEEAREVYKSVPEDEMKCMDVLRQRVVYLQEETAATNSTRLIDVKKSKSSRAMRHAIWYLLRIGQVEMARKIAERYNVAHMIDIDLFAQLKEIRSALLAGNTTPCVEWLESHRSKLRRMGSRIEVDIRIEELIDLINQNHTADAIAYIKKYIAPCMKNNDDQEVKKLIGMILTPEQNCPKYTTEEEIAERWRKCEEMFVAEFYRLYQLCTQSVFSITMQCGLAAHKTPSCCLDQRKRSEVKCPVCNPLCWPIAADLPNAHVTQSTILCTKTGEICDDTENAPYLFPSGHVYGKKVLQEQMREDNMVLCPESNKLCNTTYLHQVHTTLNTICTVGQYVRSRAPSVQFRVGDVIIHKKFGYRAIIIGWDEKAIAPAEFIAKVHDGNEQFTNNPNYAVLIDMRDRITPQIGYIVQENVEKTTGQVLHTLRDQFFERFDENENRYIMRPFLRRSYPDD
ncbi:unnamed protein product [Caenorhabditis bovis]|uniref:Macrophage erythroblast attacher n=1 Tax=Caenorhabditis bovis TaxID=2654633 RepID=A0A8S1F8J2_9PELO|nr:unnamed protein product [Caenorhabditis bovis]